MPGTINLGWVAKANQQIPSVPWLERWLDFARAVSCTPQQFNGLADVSAVGLSEYAYLAYEFNPLHRKPLIQTEADHYICVDHRLLLRRTSWGVFQDAFDQKRKGFSGPFGHAFQSFVGHLLRSILLPDAVWAESESPKVRQLQASHAKHHKLADWIYRSPERNVFIECKSARPWPQLVTYARTQDLKQVARDIAKAIQQVVEHSDAVNRGEWAAEGLLSRPATMLVVTLGRIETVNGPFFRTWIDEELKTLGVPKPHYLVLSVEELDSVIWLAECGEDFGRAIEVLAAEASFDPLQSFIDKLKERAASSFALRKAQRMWDFLPPERES